jgi:anti-sigma regulatory factor (Ser/Thr protein kinase)
MSAMQLVIAVGDQSQIGDARRQAAKVTEEAGFGENGRGRVALVITELATNLVRYGTEGQLLIRPTDSSNGRKLIEITSIDRGPGMADTNRCLADGYSTGGTSGTGLGAVQRHSATFDIYSSVPAGTVIHCQVAEDDSAASQCAPFVWSAINIPAKYEVVCGDTWRIYQRDRQLALLMVDGLGHGPDAAKASQEAADVFDSDPFVPLVTMLENMHVRMRGTRGAAVAIAQIDIDREQLKFVGVGNIAGSLRAAAEGSGRGLFSHNGIVGVQYHKAQQFEYPCPRESLLTIHSDGLQTRWSFDKYRGLSQRHPGIIAGVLYRDYCRGNDDVTVAAVRLTSARSSA